MVSSKTTPLTVRLPNEVATVIRRVSLETGKSQSQVVTEALSEWAKDPKPEKDR